MGREPYLRANLGASGDRLKTGVKIVMIPICLAAAILFLGSRLATNGRVWTLPFRATELQANWRGVNHVLTAKEPYDDVVSRKSSREIENGQKGGSRRTASNSHGQLFTQRVSR